MLVKVEKSSEKASGHQVLLIAAADSSEGLPTTIRRCFSHEITMGPLTEEQRAEMLLQSLQSFSELLSNVRVFGTELHIVFVYNNIDYTSKFVQIKKGYNLCS